jgi:tRNA:m4X modification enzyme
MESHRERKRSRPSPEVTVEELLLKWTQCHYFLPKKMRLCNLGRTPGSNYCGNHRPTGEDVTERVKRQASSGDTSRIPCPVDPSHTIYKYNVDAHIKVCNVSKHLHELEKEAYYCLGCNSGSNEIQASEMREVIDSDKLAAKIRSCYHSYVLGTLHEPVEDDNDIASIEELCISQLAKGQSSFQQLRHVKQDALIIRQMQAAHLFDKDVSKVYLELGAGKGKLGVSINAVSPLSRVVFIERSGQRRKADREGGDGNFVRIRMDIRDVIISKLPEVVFPTNKDNETRACDDTIIVAKHLCGAATDLALRSINSFRLGPSGQIAGQFKGVAVATCCHHACNWIDYTGAEWLTLRGFSGAEFEIMKYWSGNSPLSILLLTKIIASSFAPV